MLRTLLVALAVVLPGSAAAQPVIYRNATLIDGTGAPARAGMSVLVEGERIVRVARSADIASPPGARVVDLSGKFLMPGLIDSHVHLATPPNRRRAEAVLRRDLYGGVTLVRDMADDLRAVADLSRASRKGEIPAPDIRYAALMAGPSFFEDPRTIAVSFGFTPGRTPWMQAVDGKTDLREAVTLARGTSASAIKIYANLPAELVAGITAEAHRQGLQVWAHTAVYPATPADVVAARPDVLSHACSLGHAVSGTPETYQARIPMDEKAFLAADNPVVAGLLARIRAEGIVLDATTSIYAQVRGRPGLCSAAMSDALVRQAHQAGVTISAGTDWVAPWNDPWPTLHREMTALAKAGLPLAEVIKAATLNGARAAGVETETGSIQAGKLANLIVLGRDPTADLANLQSIELTVKRGREHRRADFTPLSETEMKDAE